MSGLLEGRITARHDWAPGLMTLTIEAEVEPFSPGQFLNLALQPEGQLVRRSYSIASAPGAPLQFLLAQVPRGELTPALFALSEADRVLVEPKPQGFFTLQWVPDARQLWMIATGTGLAPYLSMLRADEVWQRFSDLVLVHCVREAAQLAHAAELAALAAQHRGQLRVLPVVSREPTAPGVLHGRITSLLSDGELERNAALQLSAERSHVMLCGNPAMIDDMLERLEARGLRKHRVRRPGHVTIERYWDAV
ncbi:MAG TPA: ferredoxin--NADP reductase [Polyangiaceae bacterium]|nr:ferredoxin--NADP reductase [Polyangiaceae bacterium]